MKRLKENENYFIDEFGTVTNASTGKVLAAPINAKGYPRVSLYKEGKTQSAFVHRLVASNYLDDPSPELVAWAESTVYGLVQVNHIDGNKENNHYSNLEWCSTSQNVKHAFAEGLAIPRHQESPLSKDDILYIQANHKPRDKVNGTVALSRRYNVSRTTIRKYLKRR